MTLADQWDAIEKGLDPRWTDARLELRTDEQRSLQRAAALLAPAGPGLMGQSVRFYAARRGAGVGPEAVRRMLRRIDAEKITGTLELIAAGEAPAEPVISRASLADEWDAALAVLPADWSDLLGEVELTSSDHIERAVLLAAPLNPIQGTGRPGFRFRCAASFGYGASIGMVRRCLARLDEERFPGEVRIVRVMSDTHPVGTQGTVWMIGGKQS